MDSSARQTSPGSDAADSFLGAIAAGLTDDVRALLSRHPGLVQVRDIRGRSALQHAIAHDRQDIADLLVPMLDELDLVEALLVDEQMTVRRLLRAHPTLIDARFPFGGLPLHAAAMWGSPETVRQVIALGASPDLCDDSGRTPLRAAMEREDHAEAEQVARLLLDAGVDPNAPGIDGDSPMHAAARNGHVEALRRMIRAGGYLNMPNDDGATPKDLLRRSAPNEFHSLTS